MFRVAKSDDDWETDAAFENDLTDEERVRFGNAETAALYRRERQCGLIAAQRMDAIRADALARDARMAAAQPASLARGGKHEREATPERDGGANGTHPGPPARTPSHARHSVSSRACGRAERATHDGALGLAASPRRLSAAGGGATPQVKTSVVPTSPVRGDGASVHAFVAAGGVGGRARGYEADAGQRAAASVARALEGTGASSAHVQPSRSKVSARIAAYGAPASNEGVSDARDEASERAALQPHDANARPHAIPQRAALPLSQLPPPEQRAAVPIAKPARTMSALAADRAPHAQSAPVPKPQRTPWRSARSSPPQPPPPPKLAALPPPPPCVVAAADPPLPAGSRVTVTRTAQPARDARVLAVRADGSVKVSFDGYDSAEDEWVSAVEQLERVAPLRAEQRLADERAPPPSTTAHCLPPSRRVAGGGPPSVGRAPAMPQQPPQPPPPPVAPMPTAQEPAGAPDVGTKGGAPMPGMNGAGARANAAAGSAELLRRLDLQQRQREHARELEGGDDDGGWGEGE